jgi:hypothetical protein
VNDFDGAPLPRVLNEADGVLDAKVVQDRCRLERVARARHGRAVNIDLEVEPAVYINPGGSKHDHVAQRYLAVSGSWQTGVQDPAGRPNTGGLNNRWLGCPSQLLLGSGPTTSFQILPNR